MDRIEATKQWMTDRRASGLQEAVYYCYGTVVPGDLVEFGTMTGHTARAIAEAMLAVESEYRLPPKRFHLYDSFEGLPEPVAIPDTASPHVQLGHWARGGCKVLGKEELNQVMLELLPPDRFDLVEGWYSDTVPQGSPDQRYAFIHVDCDLYQSTIDCLTPLFQRGQVSAGAVICFDDWMCNRASNSFGERRAFIELTERFGIQSEQWGSYTWSGARFLIHNYRGCRG